MGLLVVVVLGLAGWWLGRRIGAGLVAALMAALLPLALLCAVLWDILRLTARLFAAPFFFIYAYLSELLRPRPRQPSQAANQPAKPMRTAARRTAEVIDLAAVRRRR